jgi:hypothetical protein
MGRPKEVSTLLREVMSKMLLDMAGQPRQAEPAKKKRRRPTCTCKAYPWPHRPLGGSCRHPDPPAAVWPGTPGRNQPTALRRRGLRRSLARREGLHPIRDRTLIARVMPALHRDPYLTLEDLADAGPGARTAEP